jgi:hypothetical protein
MKATSVRSRRYDKLRATFQLALSLAAGRAYGCGPCPPPSPTTVAVLPEANGDGGKAGGLPTLDPATCDRLCGGDAISCKYLPEKPGRATLVECTLANNCGSGRRPEGHVDRVVRSKSAFGAWLAGTALLERASIGAFHALHTDLRAHGASTGLKRRAKRAVEDEKRHARVMGSLARREGATVPRSARTSRARRPNGARRPLVDVAMENAIEGCARETFAALIAHVQARTAEDSGVARAMATIAREETRHAALSHDIHEWALSRLSPRDRAKVRAAYLQALESLVTTCFLSPPEATRRRTGLPTTTEAATLARHLAGSLSRAM